MSISSSSASLRQLVVAKALFLILFAFVVSFKISANDQVLEYLQPTPDWVVPFDVDFEAQVPIEKIQDGVFYRYVGNQIRVTEFSGEERHYRYTESLVNQQGIDNNSQINISFDPSYQKLYLNSLNVTRNGKVFNKLDQVKISIFNNEQELEKQIYNGSLTLNVLFDDLEVGDTIDYSYTRVGRNPIYQNIFAFSRTISWSVPVQDQQIRILWGKSKPLYLQSRNIDLDVIPSKEGDFLEYKVHQQNVATINIAGELPNWYSPYAEVLFTESESWQDVIQWAQPLYEVDGLAPSIVNVAEQISDIHNSDAEKVMAALSYAQQKIRYVGLEMGINSHLPTPADETLELKYGDCKDKALFLIHVLKAMGISAYPVLVDTEETKLLNERPPAVNRFNHVIVTLMLNGKRYWLDPTLSYQHGQLDNVYQPDYGFGLILQDGQNELTSMTNEQIKSAIEVTERFLINEDPLKPIEFNVSTVYSGEEAQGKRSQLERDGIKELSKDYEVYYQGIYAGLEAQNDVEVIEQQDSGSIQFNESYLIDNYWKEEDAGYEAAFYPYEIRNAIYKPEQIKRVSPASFNYPKKINFTTILTFEEDGWDFDDEKFIEENDVFYFKVTQSFSNKTLTLSYQYYAKSDHIPAKQMADYLKKRDLVRDKAYFGIVKYYKNESATPISESNPFTTEQISYIVLFCCYILGLIFFIISWRTESSQRPIFEGTTYFPVSVPKFLILSIVTLGFYYSYWMYRNWLYIKQTKAQEMMPIARGIFSPFWYYPLFNRLKGDSVERFGENKVMAKWLAITLIVSYFVIIILSSWFSEIPSNVRYIFIFVYVFSALIYLPLVHYVNQLNKDVPKVLQYNSKWYVRNFVAVVLCCPMLILTVGMESSLMPSSMVVEGSEIHKRDMKFLYRKNVINADESVQYFYSGAFISIRDDGNGFTDRSVFSYWDDEDGFQKELAKFEDIDNIDVTFSDSMLEDTIVTITRLDGSDFLLFLSTEADKDKIFVDKLKAQWQRKNP